MFVVTDSLTIGQLTFIVRVVLQVVSLAGPFLIGLLILSNTSRLASFSTHDQINRVVGALSTNKLSAKWVWDYSQRNTQDSAKHLRLLISITLLILYGLFSSLSDIGFLGLHSCSVPAPSTTKYEYPGSITNMSVAQQSMLSSFVKGTDMNAIKASRCESSSLITFGTTNGDRVVRNCTAWHNSTWADPNLFSGTNTTDSDALIPRSIAASYDNKTGFFVDSGSKRVETPVIKGGILVKPNDIGFQAIFGVPQLQPDQEITLDKVMALEIEIGCMSLGIGSHYVMEFSSARDDIFRTNGTWRKYSGPEILYDVLYNATDAIREAWRPVFNVSTLGPDGIMTYDSLIGITSSDVITVQGVTMPSLGGSSNDAQRWLEGNCTNSVRQKLGLPTLDLSGGIPYSCSLLGLNGPSETEGYVFGAQNRMVCATVSQINMVAATISSSTQGSISLNTTRLSSDLNHIVAHGWPYSTSTPIERWTLSDNINGATSHYIVQEFKSSSESRVVGFASGGYPLARAGTRMIQLSSLSVPTYKELEQIGGTDFETLLDPTTLTRWSGQVGASFILASLQYNPWVALNQTPILVTTRGTESAICYYPLYALGFLPLIFAAMFIGGWFIGILASTSFKHLQHLGELYGGMYPYWKSVCPNLNIDEISLVWRKEPDVQLDVMLSNEEMLQGKKMITRATDYLASASEQEVSKLLND